MQISTRNRYSCSRLYKSLGIIISRVLVGTTLYLLFVSNVFAQSTESINLAQQMYVAYYGRPGDPGGVNYWADQFDKSPSLEAVLSAFGNSQEYTDNFGSLTNEQLVEGLFKQMFNRNSDPAGLAFYVGRLGSGEATLASIAKQIADGVSGADKTVLDNKVEIANEFSYLIETEGLSYDSGDIPATQALVSSVDSSTASMSDGFEAVDHWRTGVTYYLINGLNSCDSPSNERYLKYYINGQGYDWIAPGQGQWVRLLEGNSSMYVDFDNGATGEEFTRDVVSGGSVSWMCDVDSFDFANYTIVEESKKDNNLYADFPLTDDNRKLVRYIPSHYIRYEGSLNFRGNDRYLAEDSAMQYRINFSNSTDPLFFTNSQTMTKTHSIIIDDSARSYSQEVIQFSDNSSLLLYRETIGGYTFKINFRDGTTYGTVSIPGSPYIGYHLATSYTRKRLNTKSYGNNSESYSVFEELSIDGIEIVQTNMGNFQAYRIELTYTETGEDGDTDSKTGTFWLYPEIGIIRAEYTESIGTEYPTEVTDVEYTITSTNLAY